MIKINLNPEKKKTNIIKKGITPSIKISKLIAYIGIPILFITLELVYMVYLNSQIKDLNKEKQALIKERAKYKNIKRKIDQLRKAVADTEKLKETIKLKIAVFNKLVSSKADFIPIIKAIAVSLPDGVWLSKIKITNSGGNLTGFAFNPQYISDFYDNLTQYYERINFNAVEKRISKNRNLEYYSFQFYLANWKRKEQ